MNGWLHQYDTCSSDRVYILRGWLALASYQNFGDMFETSNTHSKNWGLL